MSGTAVVVEGESDAAAVGTLARRLEATELKVVAAHGVTNYRKLLEQLLGDDPARRVAGLYDEQEEHVVRAALDWVGIEPVAGRDGLGERGFFACRADLEDELIRAVGPPRVIEIIERAGEADAFRIMRKQPAHRGRPIQGQLRRFMGTQSTRKLTYAGLLAADVDLEHAPRPLLDLIEFCQS